MDVYLIRHADAVPLGAAGTIDDAGRPLSELGRQQAERLARALPNRGARIARLFVSPLVRTQQTAEPMVAVWGLSGDAVVETEELAPNGRCRKIARRVNSAPANCVGLVGHRPDLNRFAAWLIGDKRSRLALEKAGVALIRVDAGNLENGSGELIWLVPPDWL
jgi:phosphohistidine phosphatase